MKLKRCPRPRQSVLLRYCIFLSLVLTVILFTSCNQQPTPASPVLFTKMNPGQTGINFSNDLKYDSKFNIYTYRNFYNGGGVAIGDINNDGLPDIFFTANMENSKLFLNKGNLRFEDVTEKAGIKHKNQWSTGVSMADVNGDGLIDIYVCNSGDIKGDKRQNELYINNGNLTFTERAAEFGLDERGLSTHAAFFDFDHDGDLDMFLLNNSFRAIGSFNHTKNERDKRDSIGGHKFFRNDNNHFTDISEQAGIYGSVIGFGLGVTVGDVNNDGWQDIYVSNDFFEKDYLYINEMNGKFRESLESEMMSISNASMGADMADINNDGNPDIFVTEMLPEDNASVKTKTTFQDWDKYQLDLKYGYYHQFTRNMLQLNNGNNSFSEIGRLAGVSATDWSWGALLTDLDNDGFKDIFVANGIYQDLTNEDYIQFISNEAFYRQIVSGKADYKKMIDLIPSHPISNYAFQNQGNLRFVNKAREWGLDEPGFSNGSAYGDLDNDGDLDLVINNVNMPCFVYRNNSTDIYPENKFLKVALEGKGKNRFGVGAKVKVHYNNTIAYQEQMPVRGFESTVDHRLNFGLGKATKIDSVEVLWNDGVVSVLKNVRLNALLTVKEPNSKSQSNVAGIITNNTTVFADDKEDHGLDFTHKENDFVDFDRDRLIFHMMSTSGPKIVKGDINNDGLEDLYICGAKDQPGAIFKQQKGEKFIRTNQVLLQTDAASEDTDALFFDADGDKDMDLYVCSGGNEFSPNSTALINRLYFNDGKGNFTKSPQVLPSYIFESTSCVRAADFDGDNDLDLFVGVRLIPFRYGVPCKGYVLINDGKGNFSDVTSKVAPGLIDVGMITDAAWFDYDKDNKPDLVIAGEYMPVRIFHNENNVLKEVSADAGLQNTNGWWNRLVITDINHDGYADIIAGNHGLNSRFIASPEKPVNMYIGDFSGNGTMQQVTTCYFKDSSYPIHLRHDLVSVLPYLKKKYLKYDSYKNETISDIFSGDQLSKAIKLSAYTMNTTVFINNTKGKFISKPLPVEAQFSPVYAIAADDYDNDGNIDILLGGNLFQAKPEVGIYDASYGLMLRGDGKGNFSALTPQQSGINIRGAIRDIVPVMAGRKKLMLIGENNGRLKIITRQAKPAR